LTLEPVILVDSRIPGEPVPPMEQQPRWLPGQAARAEFSGLDELERMISRRTGRRPQAVWFERDEAGAGKGPGHSRFAEPYFPRLLLTTHWPEPGQRRLAESFIDWWAPALLQLQHLRDRERARLEQAAARRASVLARLFRLYPKTLDERLIRVARVQACMQASTETPAHYEEPFLWAE